MVDPRHLAVAAAVVTAGLLSGCGGANNFSGGAVNGCFRSLPVATSALHGSSAHLLGVHRVPADRLPARIKSELPSEDDTEVCAVAFQGSFPPGRVTDARSTETGRYAVVLVDAKRLSVIASYVGTHLPRGLQGHLIS